MPPSQIESNQSKNKSRTDEPSDNSCNESEAESCFSLGMMYYRGDGVRKDHFQAIEYFRKACALDDSLGCVYLAVMYTNGEGVRQNKSKALELFGKACDLKSEIGCNNYATLKNQGVR